MLILCYQTKRVTRNPNAHKQDLFFHNYVRLLLIISVNVLISWCCSANYYEF